MNEVSKIFRKPVVKTAFGVLIGLSAFGALVYYGGRTIPGLDKVSAGLRGKVKSDGNPLTIGK